MQVSFIKIQEKHMQTRFNPSLVAILVLVVASLACQAAGGAGQPTSTPAPQQPETQPTAQTEPESTAAPTQSAVEPAAVIPSQGAGIMCAGSVTGLSCLNEDGWQVYTDENSELPNNYLYAGAICPDGKFAIAHISGVVLFDGTAFQPLPEMETVSSPEGIACDANGDIWVAHFQGVSRYAGDKWTTYGSDLMATGAAANELVYDVEVAPDGTVWVVTSNSVASFANDTWTVFQEGQGFEGSRFFSALTIDANGRPWAAHSTGVDVFENGAWTSFESTDYSTPESIAIDASGRTWMGTLTSGVSLLDGSAWTAYDRSSSNLLSNHVQSMAGDSSGRLWLGTSYGLTVYDGANWQTFLMSNSGLGDNDVRFVILTKDGPTLPALEEKENGSLTGTLEHADGTPLADAVVEICVETIASTFFGDTPCSDQPFFLSTRTDANGVFLIEDVPAGYYVIVAETATGWAQLVDNFGIASERTLIQAGEQYDVQTLTLEN
jgi:hypothetical protein